MNVINRKPLTIAEAIEYAKDIDAEKPISQYFKKFAKLSKEKSEKLVAEVRALNSPKIKEEDMIKIADLLPEDNEDVNKIFSEVGFTEEEAKAIVDIVSKYNK